VKCPECSEKLIDYLYNDLPPEERHKMDGHFKTCEHCAKQLLQLQLVRISFQQLKKQEPHSLVHQRILAHAKDMALQKRRSWLTQLLFKPSTATIIVVLLAIGIFYYTRQFTSLRIDTDKVMVKTERVREIEEKRDQISTDDQMISESYLGEKAEKTLSAVLSPGEEIEESKELTERAPISILPSLKEKLVAKSRPSAAVSGGIGPERLKAPIRMARALPEDKAGSQEPSIHSKDALYAFELGNFYFSQSDFEKAIATYSLALMMNPQEEGYADTIRYQLALSYKKLNDCKSAVKVLDEIQKRYPHHPEIDKVIIMTGDCYMDLQAYDKAEINYNNFIRKFPDRKSLVADKLEIARKFHRVNLSY